MTDLLSRLEPALGAPAAGIRQVTRGSVNFLVLAAVVLAGLSMVVAFSGPASATLVFGARYFVLDAVSRLFLLVINLVFLGVAAYLWTRVRDTPEIREQIGRLAGFSLAFILLSNLALLSHHLVTMWVLIEFTTFAAMPLIQHRGGEKRLRASWQYFLFSTVGLLLVLLGIACVGRGLEVPGQSELSYFFDDLTQAARAPAELWRRLGLVLIVLGYGTKLGLAPMYLWLPTTYQAAPPSVTALLAAVQFNVALAAMLRVLAIFGPAGRALVGPELVALGLATMVVSSFGVISTRNYVQLIAYASLNHGGVLAIGLGIGQPAAYGVVLYAVSNAFIKALLFLTAGKIEAHYKTEDAREISDLLKAMPYSGAFFMVSTFALLGFPPFGSFLGELLILSGLISTGHFGIFAAFCAILTITFAASGRALFPMIWGAPRRRVEEASQQSLAAMAPKLVFLLALLAMGSYLPAPVNDLFRQVAAGLGGE